jgi:crotonobetaine/carnitine-CoA ligase
MATYMDPTRPAVPGSMGKANPGYEVTIVEPGTDLPLPPDTPGEIVVDQKIPNIIMRAYYGMPEKTAEDFRNLKLHTGDLGRMDEDGYFYFMDRVKDYIRRRGENVSSMEVEKQVGGHPAIKEAAAIGVKAGEGASSEDEIMIVCIPEAEAPDPVEMTHWLAERMPYFMVPRYIRFVEQLPKTPTERVQKVKLREEGITADTWDREAAGVTIKR